MRIKLPPKEAVKILDEIIKKGFQVYSDILKKKNVNDPREFAIHQWKADVQTQLERIFLDFPPVYKVIKDIQTLIELGDSSYNARQKIQLENSGLLIKSIDLLTDYYDIIEKEAYSPLFYIPEKSQICFYSSIVTLARDSNEEAICKFMFELSFNEFVQKSKIAAVICGLHEEDLTDQQIKSISNGVDGINLKTNENFGFPVVKKAKDEIALSIPTQFLPEARIQLASIKA